MNPLSPTSIVLIVVLLVLLVFLIGGCSLKCGKNAEGYKRSELGQREVCNMGRSPVDFAMLPQANPHFQSRPTSKYQPLEQGPIDLYADQRKLDTGYPMFSQFRHDYAGCGDGCMESGGGEYLGNDEKTRFDLRNIGDVDIARQLDELRPLDRPPKNRIANNFAPFIDTVQTHLPYGYKSVSGD